MYAAFIYYYIRMLQFSLNLQFCLLLQVFILVVLGIGIIATSMNGQVSLDCYNVLYVSQYRVVLH